MDFRNYDPAIGRFHSADPLSGISPDWTPYRFAFNNPAFFNDPTGLWEGDDGDQGDPFFQWDGHNGEHSDFWNIMNGNWDINFDAIATGDWSQADMNDDFAGEENSTDTDSDFSGDEACCPTPTNDRPFGRPDYGTEASQPRYTLVNVTGESNVIALGQGGVLEYIGTGGFGLFKLGLKTIPKLFKTSEVASKGFSSFNAFKKVHGSAGNGKAWHHIVEQHASNITKFGAEKIHNTNNLIKLPHGAGSIHNQISGHYSSKQIFTNGQTVRQWLSTQSYQAQYDYGIKMLKQFGWRP